MHCDPADPGVLCQAALFSDRQIWVGISLLDQACQGTKPSWAGTTVWVKSGLLLAMRMVVTPQACLPVREAGHFRGGAADRTKLHSFVPRHHALFQISAYDPTAHICAMIGRDTSASRSARPLSGSSLICCNGLDAQTFVSRSRFGPCANAMALAL